MEKPSRMETAAAIDRLIDPETDFRREDCITVFRFMRDCPSSGSSQYVHRYNGGGNNKTVTGHTAEAGNVSLSTSNRNGLPDVQTMGIFKEAAGRFSLIKTKGIGNVYISIEHFLKSYLPRHETAKDSVFILEYSILADEFNLGIIVQEEIKSTLIEIVLKINVLIDNFPRLPVQYFKILTTRKRPVGVHFFAQWRFLEYNKGLASGSRRPFGVACGYMI